MYSGRHDDERIQDSAREWQKLQLGVLGFVGLCGVLSDGGDGRARPPWLAQLGAISALAGFLLAALAVVFVATVAQPVAGRPVPRNVAVQRLTVGVVITLGATALTALAALTWWWPQAGPR
ncbi:hypothetical protein MPRF_02460 [Mycolicibacterium parafortuitum]|uniref:Uncharacterized protein n=1 Tax=Mycolicibacterium parafortuitum TaxID=39692 RepID=A0A7I7TVU8_MYCPF|nr:hypothetical protein [Mycolicibacterium parafortuitum]BBY73347.1 hypothetical protein MPRF_02460 [Mycolicibacterium parafortuitum]